MEHHVCLVINDLDKELHFYRDLLGFSIIDNETREGTETGASLGLPTAKYRIFRAVAPSNDFFIQLVQFEIPISEHKQKKNALSDCGFNHIGIEVDDVDAIYSLLNKSNIEIISPPVILEKTGTKLFYARDPEGNTIEFFKLKKN
jgi:catechol 2,3-dioxygenase-like lactoylglutathione lyase family enzyme